MSFKIELDNGTLDIDAEAQKEQKHNPVMVAVKFGDLVCPGFTKMVSLGPSQFGIQIPLNPDGTPVMCSCEVKEGEELPKHVDFKEALKDGQHIEMTMVEKEFDDPTKTKDAVSFIAEVIKLRDDLAKGQILVRYATLNVVGWREELDFDPPEVTLPKEPFAHAGDEKKS